jgi:hypothetical protein
VSIEADEYEVSVGIERNGPERMIMLARDSMGTAYTGVSIPMLRYMPVEMTIRTGLDDENTAVAAVSRARPAAG